MLAQAQCSCTPGNTVSSNANLTVSTPGSYCITPNGTYNKDITLTGPGSYTICIQAGTSWSGGNLNLNGGATVTFNVYGSVSRATTVNTGMVFNNYGTMTGSFSQNGGVFTNQSGARFAPSSFSMNSGLWSNYGTTVIGNTPTLASGSTFINNDSLTLTQPLRINSSATATLGGVYNNIQQDVQLSSGGTLNITGYVTLSANLQNSGTVNVSGGLTVALNYDAQGNGKINAAQAGCNYFKSATLSNVPSNGFNGANLGLLVSNNPPAGTLTNQAVAGTGPSAPTSAPTHYNTILNGNTVTDSFNAPATMTNVRGYIILKKIGNTAPTDVPTANSNYSVGNTIGFSTVAAIIYDKTSGIKSFTDVIPVGSCGQKAYYRIFAIDTTLATGSCMAFSTTPLVDSVVIANPTAVITSAGATTFCTGSSDVLTASGAGAGGSYAWSTGATTAAITVTTAGTYTVTVTSTLGCTATASRVITVNNPGTIAPYLNTSAGGGWLSVTTGTICAGGWVEFGSQSSVSGTGGIWTISGPNGFYSYSRDTTIGNLQPVNAGTYIVTFYNANGCNATQNYTVTINAAPVATISASGPTTFCTPGSVTLTASGAGTGGTYLWSNGATTAAITVSTTGTYVVTVTSTASSCNTATASQSVTVNTTSAISPYVNVNNTGWVTTPTITLCQGGSVDFGPQPYGTWTWTGPAGFHSYQRDTTITNIQVSQSGTYTATFYNANGCNSTQNYVITVNPTPVVTVNSPSACTGATDTITATGGGTYLWSTGATTAYITTTTTGTYRVTVTSAAGCTTTASSTATISPIPSVNIVVTGACSGSASILTASGGYTYLWSNGATTAAINSTTPSSYTVTATSAAGCTASLSATAQVYTPVVSVSSNSPVCVGSTISLTATASGSSSYTYSWSGPASFTSTSANSSILNAISVDSGSYTITVTDNHGCTVTATTSVNVNGNCADSTTVGYNGGNSSDAPCTQVLRFDHYNDAVAATAAGQNHTWILSNGNRLTMTIKRTAGGFNSVVAPTWSGAAFGQSGYYNLAGKTVLYTNGGGYAKLSFSNIQMKDSLGNTIPDFTLIGIDGESTDNAERDTLTSNGSTWFDYDTITPPGVNSVPVETGIGTNTLVWRGTGASNARARLVSTQNPSNFTFSTVAGGLQGFAMAVANPILASAAVTICSNSSFSNTPRNFPVGSTTYTWATPIVSPPGSITGATAQNNPALLVSQTLVNTTNAPATVTYNIIPSNSCSGLGYTFTVTVNPAPTVSLVSNSPVCTNTPVSVIPTTSGSSSYTYRWSGPNSYTSTAGAVSVVNSTSVNAGTYTLTVTAANTCTVSASVPVTVTNCVTVSGAIFDDANGNGVQDGAEPQTSYGQALYSIIADTTGMVLSTSPVAVDGSFSIGSVPVSTSGMTVRVSTINPPRGTQVPASSWPANWIGTLGQYGNFNNARVYNNPNELIPVKTGTVNITSLFIGFDRLAAPVSQQFNITKPSRNAIQTLSSSAGLANITWTDPEDGANVGSLVIKDLTKMGGNILFYDINSNNAPDAGEILAANSSISNFVPSMLKVKFTGLGSTSAIFSYVYMDLAGKTNSVGSTYTLSWVGALPVELVSFTATPASEGKVNLDWTTASEIDNDHFEVERSDDAVNFTNIENVKGNGTTTQTTNYHTVDHNPLNGTSYYRLKQVDVDGKHAYSHIVSVDIQGAIVSPAIKVFPTLITTSNVHIAAENLSSNATITVTIVDLTGRIITQQQIATDMGGNGDFNLDIPSDIPTGTYIVNCAAGSQNVSTKVVYNTK